MNKLILSICTFSFLLFSIGNVDAQVYDPVEGCIINAGSGECLPNTILSAMPFLRIVPDARSGGC